MSFMAMFISAILFGAMIGIYYMIANNALEKKISTETNPIVQQILWQHYANYRNSDLPLPVRTAGLNAINSHFHLN